MIPLPVPDTSGARILVVGDVMLDRYWFGDVSRISPEAPVPVVLMQRSEDRPGGAANVARNARALGASVSLLAVVGEDEAAASLARLLADDGVAARLHPDAGLRPRRELLLLDSLSYSTIRNTHCGRGSRGVVTQRGVVFR